MEKLTQNINSFLTNNKENNKGLIIDIIDILKEKYTMNYEDIAMAAINLTIGEKPFYCNDDESWINKQNNYERYKSSKNGYNRTRNSSRRNSDGNTFETFKFNYGRINNIRVANIISSICTATSINGRSIGKIQIFNDYSLVDLPKNLKRETKSKLKNLKIKY